MAEKTSDHTDTWQAYKGLSWLIKAS